MKRTDYSTLRRMRDVLSPYIAVFFITTCVTAFLLFLVPRQADTAPTSSLEYAVERVMSACADEAYRPSCYDREIPKIMDHGFSMEEAFEATRIIQSKDDAYAFCHVVGHHLAAKETAKDPSLWKDVVARSPKGMCSNGGVHGAFQERFRAEHLSAEELTVLKDELIGICKARPGWNPTGLEEGSCVHAVGHLAMYVTRGDIEQSLPLCDYILKGEPGPMRQVCYDGVFMQMFQPLEPDDYALIAGREVTTQDQARTLCNRYTDEARGSCIGESWPLYKEEIHDPARVGVFCRETAASSTQLSRCYNGVFYVLTSLSNLNRSEMESYCSKLEVDTVRAQCVANVASRIIEVDGTDVAAAAAVCGTAAAYGDDTTCYEELLRYAIFDYLPGSTAYYRLCNALPPQWEKQCYTQISL